MRAGSPHDCHLHDLVITTRAGREGEDATLASGSAIVPLPNAASISPICHIREAGVITPYFKGPAGRITPGRARREGVVEERRV
eukprot:10525158-Alexandrium_andersonii.AAC.1